MDIASLPSLPGHFLKLQMLVLSGLEWFDGEKLHYIDAQ